MTSGIINDPRTIQRITWFNEEAIEVGGPLTVTDSRQVTAISAYGEPAEYCMVPWIAVHVGERNEIAMRIPAGHVEVHYVPSQDGRE